MVCIWCVHGVCMVCIRYMVCIVCIHINPYLMASSLSQTA